MAAHLAIFPTRRDARGPTLSRVVKTGLAAAWLTAAWLAGGLLSLGLISTGPIASEAQAAPSPADPAPADPAPPDPAQPDPAQAQPFPAALTPPYPDANDPVALGRWFGQTTHLPPKSILAITDNAIFAAFPKHGAGPFWTVDVRLESITPQSTARFGGRSIRLRLNVRCDNNTVRLNFLDVYPGVDLTGAPTHRSPPNGWAQPKPNSYVADAVRLACDKTFQGPFAAIAAGAPPAKADLQPVAAPGRPAPERPTPGLRVRQSLSGVYAVQIGAYSTTAAAQGAWRTLQTAKPALAAGLSNAAKPIAVGGRTLYRSVVRGFPTSAAAADFCKTLQASGRQCLALGAAQP